VLFGKEYWDKVLDMEPMVRYGTISPEDLDLFYHTDSVDEAFEYITGELTENVLEVERRAREEREAEAAAEEPEPGGASTGSG